MLKGGKAIEVKKIGTVSVHSKANFSEIKSTIEALFRQMGIEFKLERHDSQAFIPGRCATVSAKGSIIATFGEIHPMVLKNFKIEEPVVAAEISIS